MHKLHKHSNTWFWSYVHHLSLWYYHQYYTYCKYWSKALKSWIWTLNVSKRNVFKKQFWPTSPERCRNFLHFGTFFTFSVTFCYILSVFILAQEQNCVKNCSFYVNNCSCPATLNHPQCFQILTLQLSHHALAHSLIFATLVFYLLSALENSTPQMHFSEPSGGWITSPAHTLDLDYIKELCKVISKHMLTPFYKENLL